MKYIKGEGTKKNKNKKVLNNKTKYYNIRKRKNETKKEMRVDKLAMTRKLKQRDEEIKFFFFFFLLIQDSEVKYPQLRYV